MQSASIRVLLVEDVDTLRGVLRDYLVEEGFCVETAPSCSAALKIAQSDVADVIVSDIRLPDGCGVTMCRDIQQVRPTIGVVLMTGFANQPTPEWVENEKVPILVKPLDLIGLADTIRTVAAKDARASKSSAA